MKIKRWLKFSIFKVLPHLTFEQIRFAFTKVDHELLSEMNRYKQGNIYVLLACDYANMGDYAISIAQRALLQQMFPEKQVFSFVMKETYRAVKTILKYNNPNDIITMIGGGNMSELYYGYERKRNFIVQKIKNNQIIAFPQSVCYGNDKYGKLVLKRSADTYSLHSRLAFMAREKMSYETMKKIFPHNVIKLVPDVVFTLSLWGTSKRNGIVVSIREDAESALTDSEKMELFSSLSHLQKKVTYFDTCLSSKNDLQKQFDSIIHAYSSAELVVTDRLHGMIFSYITGTPALVLPNNNGKIANSYDWISDCGYITFIENYNGTMINDSAKKMIAVLPLKEYFDKKHDAFVENFRVVMDEILFN